MNKMKSSWTFYHVFQCLTVGQGNQHGGRVYDDLQNLLDMTSHESPLYREIVPPRETVAIARVAIAIVGRGG